MQAWECNGNIPDRCLGQCALDDVDNVFGDSPGEVAAEIGRRRDRGVRVHVKHEQDGRAVIRTFDVTRIVTFSAVEK